MPLPISGAQIDKLGVRLRDAAVVDQENLAMLQGLLLAYDETLHRVADQLRGIGLRPTTRLKTSGTIIDKLRREAPLTLRSIHDLAGARVVQPMSLTDQNRVCERILTLWPGAKVIDRRANPNFGYRAVHLVPKVGGCFVEIQLRTLYQDTWAQVTETFGDAWGRAVRYGGLPVDPDTPAGARGAQTRRQLLDIWAQQSPLIAQLEALEDARARLHDAMDPAELAELDRQIESGFGDLRSFLKTLRNELGLT